MSNEKDSTNRPPKSKKSLRNPLKPKKSSSGRSRNFCLDSYLIEEQIQLVLLQHSNQIKVYAYALHDKDKYEDGSIKEPHYHIVLCLYNATTVSAVRRWFSGFTDEEGKNINTLGQISDDVFNSYDYLTHNTRKAIEEGKYLYSKDIIHTNNQKYFKANEDYEYDNMTLAIMDMLNNVPLKILFKKYGRDFIIHYSACSKIVGDILLYENKGNYNFLVAEEDYYINENKKINGENYNGRN